MNKLKLSVFLSVPILSLLSSCGNRMEDVVMAQQTVPAVTFQTAVTTAVITKTETVTTVTEPPDVPQIINVSNTETFGIDELAEEYYIEVTPIYQEPELPAGCEITSLDMLLNYLGFDVDKVDLSDKYLKKNYDYTENFYEAFIGNPKDGTGFGCYSPVIAESAQKYLQDMDSDFDVYDLTGSELDDLFYYIADDKPVVIWASMSLVDVRYYNAWTIEDDGEEVWWYENEHCMLLTGYDTYNGTVTVCDPLKGEYTYDMCRFEEIYNELEKQAVTVY